MTSILKKLGLPGLALAASPFALMGAGVLFYAGIHPANAMPSPQNRVPFGQTPVAVDGINKMREAQKELYTCIAGKNPNVSRREGEPLVLDTAYNSAAFAQQRDNQTAFNDEERNFYTSLGKLKAQFGC